MKGKILIAVIVAATSCFSARSMADGTKKENAVKAAKAWLTLVDQGKYGESWEQAASYFRKATEKDKWEKTMEAFRKPLGTLVSRKLKSARYTTSLPGAPDGEYVVVQFSTSFSDKKSAIETVTPMRDKDGAWRVSGYYIK